MSDVPEPGKFHDEDWWQSKEERGTAPIRCVGLWSYGRCRAEALYGASCGRHGYFHPEPYDALGLVRTGRLR